MGGLEPMLPCVRLSCIGPGIGPFAQAGLDAALGLAVGFGRVGLGFDVFEAKLIAGFVKV